MKRFVSANIVALIALSIGASQASAHAIVIGYTPGANAGELNLWLGSYHGNNSFDGPSLEGSARLQGPGGYDTTSAFNYSEGISSSEFGPVDFAPVPAGLVLGTNLFASQDFANSWTGGNISVVPSWVNSWEAVTITGLSAGAYTFTYVPVAFPSAHWAPWIDLQSVVLNLTQGDTGGGGTNVGGVPEPMSLAIWGLGGLGLAVVRARRNRKVA